MSTRRRGRIIIFMVVKLIRKIFWGLLIVPKIEIDSINDFTRGRGV